MSDENLRVCDDLPAASAGERRPADFNRAEASGPSWLCVQELFEAQVVRDPGKVAVVYESAALSYAELNRRSNRLAHYLRGLGVGPDVRVGVCLERSLELVVGLLGILKAGGAYVALDPAGPSARLAYTVEDSAPEVILGHDATRGALDAALSGTNGKVRLLDLVSDAPLWAGLPAENPARAGTGREPDHLAYIMYTSGSTGNPKGVMIEHRGLSNRLLWMQDAYGLTSADTVLQKTPFSFDVSVWEFFWPLMTGARLVVAKPGGHKDPAYLEALIRDAKVTVLHFVPSMLKIFLDHLGTRGCPPVRLVFCSGEALSSRVMRQFFVCTAGADLHNLYGPTEATIDVTAWHCREDHDADRAPPIGRPIANTQIYLLDGQGHPLPVGGAGELYIGGVGVARGYLNRPELTAERFIDSPFVAGDRLYRTGDLARYLADGNLEFLGRNDFQVKIRGFRVELGEIEAQMSAHAGVRDAVVTAREAEDGDKRLVGYYTRDDKAEVNTERLRAHLSSRLPDYMVPAAFVCLQAFPLTPSGKLDRKALPAPEGDVFARPPYAAPEGELEAVVAAIWADILEVELIGRYDDFFDLGGHSLMALKVLERIHDRLNVQVPLFEIFDHSSLIDLAVIVDAYRQ